MPGSPGDEPAVPNSNYFTTRPQSNLFNETSSAARARRRAPSSPDEDRDSAFMEKRQSTPYQTRGGEKFDPWNGASNIGRSRSTRESKRRPYDDDEAAQSPPEARHQRSSSVPDDSDNLPRAEHNGKAGFSNQRSSSTTSASSDYRSQDEGLKNGFSDNGKDSSKLYAAQSQFQKSAPHGQVPQPAQHTTGRAGMRDFGTKPKHTPPSLPEMRASKRVVASSSGETLQPKHRLNAFEEQMSCIIKQLSALKYGRAQQAMPQKNAPSQPQSQFAHVSSNHANLNPSFGSPFSTDSFKADSHRFTRNSTDNINTRFVAEDDATSWQFNAGSPIGETGRPAMPRSKSGNRMDHGSPLATDAPQTPFAAPRHGQKPTHSDSFNPEEWAEQISPNIFAASASQKASTLGRSTRGSGKKPKPVRMTAGTAGLVESDDSGSSLEDLSKGSPTPARAPSHDATPSPMAMDVDPPVSGVGGINNSARNIPVTPSRPEWRAGDVGLGIKVDANQPPLPPPPSIPQPKFGGSPPAAAGSEDSEEFRTSFRDIRNVEPFAERATGLESFGDLKSNLPFPSVASNRIPPRKPVSRTKNIQEALPESPKPPNPPPTLAVAGLKPSALAWKHYVEAFYAYLAEFQSYNTKFIDHFSARRVQVQQKLGNPAWLESRDGAGLDEYMTWAEEDREVRKKWMDACNDHEMNLRLFAAHRDKMMK